MNKNVSVVIGNGLDKKVISIDVLISDETREFEGTDFHLVKHDNARGFRYLATPKAIANLDKQSEKSLSIMDELEETL
jgi:hypothetical protein|tara:strand:+ start:950 stop:1183 length:234 start_codon:yes stop_codon:yes gene_type:complete